tara:strand:- start:1210 stop:1485 length:276 start_codon:yes stop_codon:yes gene_type:complete
MSTAAAQFKILPENIDIDLEKLQTSIKEKIESFKSGVVSNIKEEPIAFGLKALIVTFAISEEQEIDQVENAASEIKGISSVELIDYRRAIG